MVYLYYDPDNRPYYTEISEAEYALMILSGEWKDRGVTCKRKGCETCGGDGNNRTLVRRNNAV